jgi:hypothetical protein
VPLNVFGLFLAWMVNQPFVLFAFGGSTSSGFEHAAVEVHPGSL